VSDQRLSFGTLEHLGREVDPIDVVPEVGKWHRQRACAAAKVGDTRGWDRQPLAEQFLPGSANGRIQQTTVGSFVERLGLGVPACHVRVKGHGSDCRPQDNVRI
jgi:hypothetical protein